MTKIMLRAQLVTPHAMHGYPCGSERQYPQFRKKRCTPGRSAAFDVHHLMLKRDFTLSPLLEHFRFASRFGKPVLFAFRSSE